MPSLADVDAVMQSLPAPGSGDQSGAAQPPSYPMVAPHPSGEAGFLPQTNLSPADLAKFNAGQQPPPAPSQSPLDAAMPAPTYSSPDLAAKMDIAKRAAAGPLPMPLNPEFPTAGKQTGYLANVGAGTSEAVAQLLGMPADLTNAVLNAGLKAVGLPQVPVPLGGAAGTLEKLFGLIGANPQNVAPANQGERLARAAARGATAVALPGGIASKLVRARAWAAAPALASLAQGAGVGGAAAGAAGGVGSEIAQEVVPEPLKPLAGMIGGMAAAAPVAFGTAAATAAGRAATEGITRALTPSARIPEIVGKTVTEAAGGVPAATPAPIPSVPLNLAQTTARPEVASALDVLNAQNVPAMQAERSAQNTAMVNAISGQAAGEPALHAPAAVGGAQVPEVIAGRGSTAATGAVQQAAKIIASEEGRVWNKPSLTEPRVSSETGKRLVEAEVRALRRDQPGLALALDESAALQRTIRELELMPEKAAANQLNAISSRFKRIARDPGEAADVRLVATRLANAAQEGIWQAPEVAGRAPATQAELEAATAAQQPAAPVRPAWAGGAPLGRAPLHGEVLGRGDLWRSTPEQLEQMLAEKEASDEEKLVRALGSKERADRFNRLDRAQNSSNPDRADRAKKQMDEEFGQLTPEQERLIYGIGESDASAEDIRQVLAAAGEHNSNPADAAYQAALAMRGVPARQIQAVQAGGGSAAAQAAFVRLGNAYSDMVAAGVPRERIPNLIVSSLVRQGWSEPDAQEVIGHALAGFQRATAPAQAAGPARAALPSPGD